MEIVILAVTLIEVTTAPVWLREYSGTRETLVYVGGSVADGRAKLVAALREARDANADMGEPSLEFSYRVRHENWLNGEIVSTRTHEMG